MPAAVLVPIKAFGDAKVRLADVLAPARRDELARQMAARVLAAAAPLPVAVVCDDDAVATFAAAHGADVLWTPGLGLNGAVAEGVALLAAAGYDEVVVAHADLPLADRLDRLTGSTGVVTLVPDRHDDGTNVVVLPSGAGFEFRYGPGSFAAHLAEVERLGLVVRVARDPLLGWDVDVPADLDVPSELGSLPCASG